MAEQTLNIEKAINRLFEAYGELLTKVRELNEKLRKLEGELIEKADILRDSKVLSREIIELGRYKQEHCQHYRNGKCTVWIYTKTKEPISPSLIRCALCWLFKPKG